MNDFLKIVSLEIKLQGIAQLLYFSLCYKFRTTLLKLYLLSVCLFVYCFPKTCNRQRVSLIMMANQVV